MNRTRLVAAGLLVVALTGCGGDPSPAAGPANSTPVPAASAGASASASPAVDPNARQKPGPPMPALNPPQVTLTTGEFTEDDADTALGLFSTWIDLSARNPALLHTQPKTVADFEAVLPLYSTSLRADVTSKYEAFLRSPLNDGTDTSEQTTQLATATMRTFAVQTTLKAFEAGLGVSDTSTKLGDSPDPAGLFGPVTVENLRVYDGTTKDAGKPVLVILADVTVDYNVREGGAKKAVRSKRALTAVFDKRDGPLLMDSYVRDKATTETVARG